MNQRELVGKEELSKARWMAKLSIRRTEINTKSILYTHLQTTHSLNHYHEVYYHRKMMLREKEKLQID